MAILEKVKKELRELSEIAGVEYVDKKEASRRIEICESNGGDGGCFWQKTRQCGKCKCFMDVKTKLKKLPFEKELISCPLKKW